MESNFFKRNLENYDLKNEELNLKNIDLNLENNINEKFNFIQKQITLYFFIKLNLNFNIKIKKYNGIKFYFRKFF